MKIFANLILLTAALAVVSAAGDSESALDAPNSSWAETLAAIERVDTRRAILELNRLAVTGQKEALLERIAFLAARSDWPPAAREFTLLSFTHSLADREPGTVAAPILASLAAIRPSVRVPHPDDDRLGLPAFNIPAAASGVATEWRRRDAARSASRRLAGGTAAWISGYEAGDPIERKGYLAALDDAGATQLNALADAVEQGMRTGGGHAEVVARIGVLLADEERFARGLAGGRTDAVAELTRAASAVFDTHQALRALRMLERTADPSTTSVALAELAAGLTRSPAGTEHLFELVGNEALGLSAALALARHGDGAARDRLAAIAGAVADDRSRRAAIALAAGHAPGSAQ